MSGMSDSRERAYPDTWRLLAQDYDPNDHLMKLKGKDYLDVQNRMVWFIRDQRALIVAGVATQPYAVATELVELDRDGGWAHFRTTVRDVLGNAATAYGSESAKDFGDYIEKAATKSLGRALIGLGYGTQFAPEISDGEEARPVDSPVAPAAHTPRLHNHRTEQPVNGPTPTQAPQNTRSTVTPPPASPRPQSGASDDVGDERVAQALRNRTVLELLTALGVKDQTPRREKVAASFAILDRQAADGAPASIRDLIEALEAKIAAKKREQATKAVANNYDLHDLATGTRPN